MESQMYRTRYVVRGIPCSVRSIDVREVQLCTVENDVRFRGGRLPGVDGVCRVREWERGEGDEGVAGDGIKGQVSYPYSYSTMYSVPSETALSIPYY